MKLRNLAILAMLTALLSMLATFPLTTRAHAMAEPDPAAPADPCAHLPAGSAKWKTCRERNGLPTTPSNTSSEALVLGYALAKAGRFEDALNVLRAVEAENDPRVLTYIGFAERKLGRTDVAMTYYRRALAISPTNVATLEYLGEAHVQLGEIAAAKARLSEIASICGRSCEAYTKLAEVIAGTSTDQSIDQSKVIRRQ